MNMFVYYEFFPFKIEIVSCISALNFLNIGFFYAAIHGNRQ